VKNLTINKRELAELVFNNIEHAGSTDWGVYIDTTDNALSIRHISYQNANYILLFSFYSCWDREQFSELSIDESIDWLCYAINWSAIEELVESDSPNCTVEWV
jgi:hypothetical protein